VPARTLWANKLIKEYPKNEEEPIFIIGFDLKGLLFLANA
jgi:hypothetical protein